MKRLLNLKLNLKVKYGYENETNDKFDISLVKFCTSDPVYFRLIILLLLLRLDFIYQLSESIITILHL